MLPATIDDPAEATAAEHSSDALVSLAERLMRCLVNNGWHPSHLHAYFASDDSKVELLTASNVAGVIAKILARFPDGHCQLFTIYTPRLIGRGGDDWGFTSVHWNDLPTDVQVGFSGYIAGELRVDPDTRTAQHDAGYKARYKKWLLERCSLTLSKYVCADVSAPDPYSAADVFREKYRRMKSVLYISRKSTGSSSEKSVHSTHRNVGRSPVQLQDVSVVRYPSGAAGQPDGNIVIAHLNAPTFPYQKLKNEFARQRELLALFVDRCVVFRQLSISYANALEAFANRDIDAIVRNLAVATELLFASDHFDGMTNTQKKGRLLNEGALLLTLDWLRDQFQSLTFLTKLRSPGRSVDSDALQIHLQILDDDSWRAYATKINAPALLRWRRDRLMSVIRNPVPGMNALRVRFEAELAILWHARHAFAHRASVFREGYFVALLLNLFRIALDYRFSCYAVWVEWHAGRRIEGGPCGPEWTTYQNAFVDGWKAEFAQRVSRIAPDFRDVTTRANELVKSLVLGAGYAGLGVHPRRTTPARPISV